MKSIYDLELHESIVVNGINIMRVPGGWLYNNWNLETDQPEDGVFVPFNNEFQEQEE